MAMRTHRSLNRASAVGEFGGLGYAIKGHLWCDKNWGYQSYENEQELLTQYDKRIDCIKRGRREQGLQAAVYTQMTDVEGEVNGLLTYDRKIIKLPPGTLKPIHKDLLSAPNHKDLTRS